MNDLIEKKAMELAAKHAEIIEEQCKTVCDLYKCKPEDLVIEYQGQLDIRINIKACHFKITNNFTYEDCSFKPNITSMVYK